jgi:hypothetical protein
MSNTEAKAQIKLTPLSLQELTEVLVRHYGLTEGNYDLLINYQVGAGMFGPTPSEAGPGLAVSPQQIGLAPSKTTSHLTVDAAKVEKRKKKV